MHARQTGERALRFASHLALAVKQCILTLGNAFLAHSENDHLRESIRAGVLAVDRFYQSQLVLVYRLLVLRAIEDRDLVFAPTAPAGCRTTYIERHGVNRLRDGCRVAAAAGGSRPDPWLALCSTFELFEPGGSGKELGLAPLSGWLFDPRFLAPLRNCRVDGQALYDCLARFFWTESPGESGRRQLDFAEVDVEELGSIYETLLQYEPRITACHGQLEFTLEVGRQRAVRGAHFTPNELVHPLITHSLDHVIAERLEQPDPEQGLLSISICDIACGTGHILLQAARRVAVQLAALRSGREEPSRASLHDALRDVIRSCIYGVDVDPLAVELCRIVLWLEARVPGEPLSFLNDRIKCGNAIVGLARETALNRGIPDEAFRVLPGDDAPVAAGLRKANRAERRGIQLREFVPRDEPPPVDLLSELPDASQLGIAHASLSSRVLADLQVAQFYIPKTPATRPLIATEGQYRGYLRGAKPRLESVEYASSVARRERFFHWFLEFPQVFSRGGFDCLLGNPPYLGNRKLKATYGLELLNWVRFEYAPAGSVDLATYFLRRMYELLRPGGYLGVVATNTLAQGAAREGGLLPILEAGGVVNFADPSRPWPGSATVDVALLTITKGPFSGSPVLTDREVVYISSYLDSSRCPTEPQRLSGNRDLSFQGTILCGKGFILTPAEAADLLAQDELHHRVIFPYLTGDDLTTDPQHQPSRFVINFHDWSREQARDHSPACFHILEQRVRPERTRRDERGQFVLRAPLPQRWWLYADKRPKLYAKLRRLQRTLAINRHSKFPTFVFCPTHVVFSEATVVVTLDTFSALAVLNSNLHEAWAWWRCSTLGTAGLRYTPSRGFDTFPFPLDYTHDLALEDAGRAFDAHRDALLAQLQLGLTELYNLYHRPALSRQMIADTLRVPTARAAAHEGLLRLRDLQRSVDQTTLAAYGWNDRSPAGHGIALRHDFYELDTLPAHDRIRYTIHPAARAEILTRLAHLNRQRSILEQSDA